MPVSGPIGAAHHAARIMIRIHGAPVGYVEVEAQPLHTLDERAVEAAERALAGPLRRHRACDKEPAEHPWETDVSCPRLFPRHAGVGLTVIVCTRDRPTALSECLGALRRVRYQPLEVLVVDNAPSDNATQELVQSLALDDPRLRYTREPRPGLSRARNHGVLAAKYDLLAFTDDDIVVDPGWPEALVAGFAADPHVGCVTGLVASRSLDTGAERYFDSRYSWGDAFDARRYDLAAHRHDSRLYPFSAGIFGTGANFALRRETVDAVGQFDPVLGAGGPGRGGEDLDMFLRVILAGSRLCYLPAALVWHQHRTSDDALAEQVYSYGYGLGAYLAKRLLTREMPMQALLRGLGPSAATAGRMRDAAQASQLKSRGGRLAATEVMGVVAGAVRFYRMWHSRRKS
jgi:GT2 family glycosyltransferase